LGIFLVLFFLIGCASLYSEEKILVMFGDSTTLCSRNSPGFKLTDLVQAYLTKKIIEVKVVNAGVGGNTAKQGYARIVNDVISKKPHRHPYNGGRSASDRRGEPGLLQIYRPDDRGHDKSWQAGEVISKLRIRESSATADRRQN
jgi:hypothetical protein